MAGAAPIAIVGSGIVGTSLAYHLRDADRDVVLLEASNELGGGTTSESAGMVGLEYPAPVALKRTAWHHYRSLIEEGAVSFERIGRLVLREPGAGRDELDRIASAVETLGHDADRLDREGLERFGIDPPGSIDAVWIPDEGYLDPTEVVVHWVEAAQAAGVTIRTGTPVTDVRVDDTDGTTRCIGVETPDGAISASAVVNAAGPWAPQINDLAGISFPLRHNHGPMLVVEAEEPLWLPSTSFPNDCYVRREGRQRTLVGRRGRAYENASRLDPDAHRAVPEEFRHEVKALLAEWIPALADAPVVDEWLGMRTITPDGHPVVGETSVDGFWVACGFNGMGITLAPAIGQLLAAALTTSTGGAPQAAIVPGRFAE